LTGPSGLMHAIVTRIEDGKITLVAGERRLRAMDEIWDLGGTFRYGGLDVPEYMVPHVDIGELDPLDAKVAEYEENVRRLPLTWDEQCLAEKEIYELRLAISRRDSTPAPTLADVAKETRGEATTAITQSVSRNIVLANNLHRPEVRNAKSAAEAFKALKRQEETERNEELAAALGPEFIGSQHQLINGDSLEWMAGSLAGTFDVICTDPPYGMGADEFGDSGGGAAGAHFYEDSDENFQRLIRAFAPESYRLAKPDAHLYCFCDFAKFQYLQAMFSQVGWRVFRTPLIWYKPSAFRAPWPEQGPQRKYECVVYAVKGNLKCTTLAGDVITCPPDDNLGHNAQKPVALIRDLLARSVRPGFRVLDPFCGTGPIFPAAHSLNAIATGIELDGAAYAIAATRLGKIKAA
jgi:site-specific DNA-methyltransferase (adenine-specific)